MKRALTKQVILSHTRSHEELAKEVARILKEKGLNVWTAEESQSSSSDWEKTIESALQESDSMIAILNPHSFSSSWVRKELQHALFDNQYKHRLLPVLVGDQKEEFSRLPWVLNRLQVLRIREEGSIRKNAKIIAEAFINLLIQEQEEAHDT